MTQPGTILIVDDEQAVRLMLETALRAQGHRTHSAPNGAEALALITSEPVDVVLLDLHLGDMDGVDVLIEIRRIAPEIIVIMLTAHGSMHSAIAALRHGAFDYLLKPAQLGQIRECVERGLAHRRSVQHQADLIRRIGENVQALGIALNLSGAPSEPPEPLADRLVIGGLSLNLRRHTAMASGQPLQLTRSEFVLLANLAQHLDTVCSYTDLAAEIYGRRQSEEESRALLRPHIARLRQKMAQAGILNVSLISVRSVGYMLRSFSE